MQMVYTWLYFFATLLTPTRAVYVTTLEIRHEFGSPDCVDRLVVNANHSIPGPAIEVDPGEEVEITVVNKMLSNAVSIHWHGMVHADSGPWHDGGSMITQCPIPPGSKWVYKFKVNDHPGLYQYHGHIGGMRVAGLGGAFIIKGDVSAFASEADGGEVLMHLKDWWHAEETQLVQGVLEPRFRWVGDPQSVLVNGQGHFDCSDNALYSCDGGTCMEGEREVCGAAQSPWYRPSYHPPSCDSSLCPGYFTTQVTAGKTYLLRFINGGSLSLFSVAIENHNMTVIEVDGMATQKHTTDTIDLNSGQRVSVLVTMDQPPGAYTVKVITRGRSSQRTGYAIIEYAGAASQSVQPETANVSTPAWDDNNFTFDFQQAIKGLYTGDTAVAAVPDDSLVQRTFYMLSTQERMDHTATYNGVPSVNDLTVAIGGPGDRPQDNCDSAGNTKNLRWLLGRRSWMGSNTPTLASLYFDINRDQISEEHNYFAVDVGQVYDVVIQNYPACNGHCETHAFHAHGMHFWVLGTGRGEWTGSAEQLASLNKVDPAFRDVTQVVSEGVNNEPFGKNSDDFGPCGWTMIRFKVYSPGAWYFHCHMIWHILMGQNAVFYTPADTIPAPPDDLLFCGDMTMSSALAKQSEATTTSATDSNIEANSGRMRRLGTASVAAGGVMSWLPF